MHSKHYRSEEFCMVEIFIYLQDKQMVGDRSILTIYLSDILCLVINKEEHCWSCSKLDRAQIHNTSRDVAHENQSIPTYIHMYIKENVIKMKGEDDI